MTRILLTTAACTWTLLGIGAEWQAEDFLTEAWYETEVVIFTQTAMNTRETGGADAGRMIPPEILPLTDPRAAPRVVDPSTATELMRPVFEQPLSAMSILPPDWLVAPLPDNLNALRTEGRSRPAGVGNQNVVRGAARTDPGRPMAGRTMNAPGDPAAGVGPPLTPVETVRAGFEQYEDSLRARSYRWSTDGLRFRGEARRVRRSGDYTLLHHGKWLQPVPDRSRPQQLFVQLGERLPDGRFRLEGLLNVTLGRYLHFGTDLWLHEIPVLPAPFTGERYVKPDPLQFFQLRESRRMRSEEPHHLDHPAFGVLVRIDPVALPRDLVGSVRALEVRKENGE